MALAKTRLVVGVLLLAILVIAGLAVVSIYRSNPSPDSIRVAGVWSDGVDSPPGMRFYLLDVNASNGQSSVWKFDPSHFTLTSNSSKAYSPVENYSLEALLKPSLVSPGGQVTGFVAFLLASSEVPSELRYEDPTGFSLQTTSIPAVSAVASAFDPSVHVTFDGTPAADAVATWDGITNNTKALAFFGIEPGYRNDSFVFFTGQKIYVTLALYYYKYPSDPNSISVDSVTSDDGYAVSDIIGWQASLGVAQANQLPVTLVGYGSNAEVTLLVTVPPGPQPGVLHFTIHFSS